MKHRVTIVLLILMTILFLGMTSVCAWLLLFNSKQKKEIEAQKQSLQELSDELNEYKTKAEQLENQLKMLPNGGAASETAQTEDPTDTAGAKKQAAPKKAKKYADISDLEHAKAKGLVNIQEIDSEHLENYFMSYPISDEVFARIYGDDRSFKTYCTVERESLVYLKVLHYDYNGDVRIGEMISSVDISEDLIYIFRSLYENKYPIEKMVLVDEYGADDDTSVNDNNTSCFNFRTATDSDVLSRHATGHAVDINPLQNPYFRVYEDGHYEWDNTDANLYWDRTNDPENRHMINYNDLCYQLFTERGFEWGGDWPNPIDYQHFQK